MDSTKATPGFTVVQPGDRRFVPGLFAGTYRELMFDEATPTQAMVAGIVRLTEKGKKVSRHRHTIEEFQYVMAGTGVVRDAEGKEYPVGPGTAVYCPPGAQNAHEFENLGEEPLDIMFVFPSPGGKFPEIYPVQV